MLIKCLNIGLTGLEDVNLFLPDFQICEKVTKDGWTVVRDPENRMGPYAYKVSMF
jgi:hypothetical protein